MVPAPRLEKISMHFWTLTLNKTSFPWNEGGEGFEIHKTPCKDESTPALPLDSIRSSLTRSSYPECDKPLAWSDQVSVVIFFSLNFGVGGFFSKVLDPWTRSAVLNILSTVCLPLADLPDMLSSWLAGDATSLRISPANHEAPLHFLWINSHTVGGKERPGHGGTGAELRRKHTHTFFLWSTTLLLKNNTNNPGYSVNPLGQSLMVPLKALSGLKRPETSIIITASPHACLDRG